MPGLRKALSSHFDVGQDGSLFDSLIDFWWSCFRAAESQTHAVAVIERVIPESMCRPDRAFWCNPGPASNHSFFSECQQIHIGSGAPYPYGFFRADAPARASEEDQRGPGGCCWCGCRCTWPRGVGLIHFRPLIMTWARRWGNIPLIPEFNYFFFMLFLIRSRVARYSWFPGSEANAFSMAVNASACFSAPIATSA